MKKDKLVSDFRKYCKMGDVNIIGNTIIAGDIEIGLSITDYGWFLEDTDGHPYIKGNIGSEEITRQEYNMLRRFASL